MRLLTILFIACLSVLSACETRTQYGECIGIDGDKDPNLHYKVSTTNVVWGVVFVETIIVPVVVLLDETDCPVGLRQAYQHE